MTIYNNPEVVGTWLLIDEPRIQAIFTEWLKRYNENPSEFAEEYVEEEDYGKASAKYFMKLVDELYHK